MGESSPAARYGAEFVGTFMLVFTIGCNVLSGQPVWGGISIACVLTVMIYALGKSSGANFNPAVSVGLGLADKLPWGEVVKYSVVQIIAGLLAGACYSGLFRDSFTLKPAPGHNMRQAVVAEMLYTFMLVFVVLNVAASKFHAGKNQFYGLAIGFVIVAGAYSGGSVSGGCFNPAVAIGLDLAAPGKATHDGTWISFVYTFFELCGAAMAAAKFTPGLAAYVAMHPASILSGIGWAKVQGPILFTTGTADSGTSGGSTMGATAPDRALESYNGAELPKALVNVKGDPHWSSESGTGSEFQAVSKFLGCFVKQNAADCDWVRDDMCNDANLEWCFHWGIGEAMWQKGMTDIHV